MNENNNFNTSKLLVRFYDCIDDSILKKKDKRDMLVFIFSYDELVELIFLLTTIKSPRNKTWIKHIESIIEMYNELHANGWISLVDTNLTDE
jgi:Leu/Phe-tRNA-protein transferase